ncbi:hypothetical protein EYF80_068360 [Liparis tanakae]|uniref:Uncharacterized protein n=1 Tax=Liparis tanakae TaxID=230148 RepID=A0A4Z2DYL6_9TELE|nr:hypothetical protein EYF80_068360 [Liparis tanakae]
MSRDSGEEMGSVGGSFWSPSDTLRPVSVSALALALFWEDFGAKSVIFVIAVHFLHLLSGNNRTDAGSAPFI